MLIGRHTATTRILGAPSSWNETADGHCARLPIADVICDGARVMESAWLPTPGELELLVAGAPIILGILGEYHPPVYLTVGAPPNAA